MSAVDWTPIYEKYKGKWVALKDDEVTVISSGSSVRSVMEKAKKQGVTLPIVMRVPTQVIPYIGGFFT